MSGEPTRKNVTSPTPWSVAMSAELEGGFTATVVKDANGICILTANDVVSVGSPPDADAVLAVEAVNRMAKMDEAAKIQAIAKVARPLPMGAGYAAIRHALDLLGAPDASPAEDVMRRALDDIASGPHDEQCRVQEAMSLGDPTEGIPCSCHVGVAEQALRKAALLAKERPAEKPVEHVAVVRPDQLGTVHFVPSLTDVRGDVIDRLDFEHRPDGTLRLTVMARRSSGSGSTVVADICPRCHSAEDYGYDGTGFMYCRECGFTGPEIEKAPPPTVIKHEPQRRTAPYEHGDPPTPYMEFPVDPNKPKEPKP